MRLALAAVLLLLAREAHAATGQPSDCSGSIGASAANVSFPASGKTGPKTPSEFVTIQNTHASQNLCVAAGAGVTASCTGSGSFQLVPSAVISWSAAYSIPASISVIGSGSATTYHCEFK